MSERDPRIAAAGERAVTHEQAETREQAVTRKQAEMRKRAETPKRAGAHEQGETRKRAEACKQPEARGQAEARKQAVTHEQTTALWVGAFFDELVRWGVRDVVVSPGSRSTALAMAAFELSCRRPDDLHLYVDVDERGAAFFALGMAKASGRPAACVCTSGTALANYYPAVIEAETSRVPLLILSGDRPPQLQGLGAPQTTDQLKAYGDHVRAFRAMPLPSVSTRNVAFARQAAREACLAAAGGALAEHDSAVVQVASRGCMRLAGPVHVNFPFDEPLKPDFAGADALVGDAFALGRRKDVGLTLVGGRTVLDESLLRHIERMLASGRALVLAGEGTCSTLEEAREVVAWARSLALPLLADPLSGLRSVEDDVVIGNYDNIARRADCPAPEVVIRFGRYPVSKHATIMAASVCTSIVVDVAQTRDFNSMTDVLVTSTPLDFVRNTWEHAPDASQCDYLAQWKNLDDDARKLISARGEAYDSFEGTYVSELLRLAPAESCVFVANSMSVRALDTFYLKGEKPLCVLCNRGQNGIDGTTSTALGAAQKFAQTTFLTGDFTLLHDLSALALQRELAVHHAASDHSVVIVLLNNNGGAIFDMLPQASDDAYFERLFLVPQDVDFEHAARAFGVTYRRASTVEEFGAAYRSLLGRPGISLVEVGVPLRGVKERYGAYQG